ncbi:MAG: HAMP domain-containing protein [Proteobacteria bacterium]|nr:HAMP domain-containing protein [Pseudomonadota bacterium]
MHSLYWRIFLAFWVALALILVGTVTVAVSATAHRTDRPWIERAQLYAQAAQAFQHGGPSALTDWLNTLRGEVFSHTFVVGPDGKDLLGRPLPAPLIPPRSGTGGAESEPEVGPGAIAPIGGALILTNAQGATWHVVSGPVRATPRLFGELELPGVPLALLVIALTVSAAVCLVLARYLAAPVDRLRLATRRLAGGDLNVRVLPTLRRRPDDLGLLAADLDAMAERLRQLLEGKQQLLRDVSHELRSPLARLQLALSLARRDPVASERHLERVASEADRLEQLIARTLRLVRLERPVHEFEHVSLDIAALIRTIIADVAIEADAQGCRMSFLAPGPCRVSGDEELLRSAFENVIRNAVRYSPQGAEIEVALSLKPREGAGEAVEVTVRDRGPGVPDKDLRLIFEPFYRVDAAREHRRAGGEGLGLAIAARAIALHGGRIEALNAPGGGLLVRASLPADGPASARQPAAAPAAAA